MEISDNQKFRKLQKKGLSLRVNLNHMFSLLWFLYALFFVLSIRKEFRPTFANCSIHPSFLVLFIILISVLHFAPLLRIKKNVQMLIFGGFTYTIILLNSSLLNFLILDYPFKLRFIIKWIVLSLIVFLITLTVKHKKDIIFIMKGMVFSVFLMCVYGIVYSYLCRGGSYPINPFRGIASNNALLNWTAGLFVLTIYLADQSKLLKGKIFWFSVLLILIFAQIATNSRFGWIIIFISFVLYITLIKKKIFVYLVVCTLIGILSLSIFPQQYTQSLSYEIKKRINSTFFSKEKLKIHIRQRTIHFEKGVHVFLNNPIIGVGSENYKHSNNFEWNFPYANPKESSHCLYIKILAETGTLGILILGSLSLSVLLLIYRTSIKLRKEKKILFKVLWISILMFLFRCVTANDVIFIPTFGLVFGLALSYTYRLLELKSNHKEVRINS
jgi:O-antigen ligase